MSKVCAKCGVEKDNTQFRRDNKSKDKLGCWCKDCDREYKRIYYAQNKDKLRRQINERYKNDPEYRAKQQLANKAARERHLNARKEHEKEYRRDLQRFIDESLKTPCVKCGEQRPWLIHFHHIDPAKKAFQIQATKTKSKLIEESKKCVCLCSNCHSEYHYFFGKQPENPIESLNEYLSEEFDGNATYLRKCASDDFQSGS